MKVEITWSNGDKSKFEIQENDDGDSLRKMMTKQDFFKKELNFIGCCLNLKKARIFRIIEEQNES